MFEVKVKVGIETELGESVISLTTSSTGYIRCKKLLKFLFISDKMSSI